MATFDRAVRDGRITTTPRGSYRGVPRDVLHQLLKDGFKSK
jgi:hypothetical protein